MPKSRPFLIGYGIIIVLVIILLGSQVSFIFQPVVAFVQALFIPFLLAGVLYYLFRPIVRFLHLYHIPKPLAILLIYLLSIGVIVLIGFLLGPLLQEQFENLIENLPGMLDMVQKRFIELSQNPWVSEHVNWDEVSTYLVDYLQQSLAEIGDNIASFFSILTNIVIVLVTVPFILYYLLLEGEKTPDYLLRFLPIREQSEGKKILSDMDHALSSYIKGQIMVSVFVGGLVYIGYLIIDINYSLILALITMFTNVIPFVGPFLGTIPAVIVALIEDPIMVFKVLIVTVVAQQLEGNLVSPLVMGKSLKVHPLTIILLLIGAGSLGGFLGLLLAVPTYAVVKVVVSHVYRLVRLRNYEKLLIK